jgi:hypothetical protein
LKWPIGSGFDQTKSIKELWYQWSSKIWSIFTRGAGISESVHPEILDRTWLCRSRCFCCSALHACTNPDLDHSIDIWSRAVLCLRFWSDWNQWYATYIGDLLHRPCILGLSGRILKAFNRWPNIENVASSVIIPWLGQNRRKFLAFWSASLLQVGVTNDDWDSIDY